MYLEKLNTSLLYLDQRLDRLSPSSKLEDLKKDLERYHKNLGKNFRYILDDKNQKVMYETNRLKNPIDKIHYLKEKQVQLDYLLNQYIESIFLSKQKSFDSLTKSLNALSPLRLMDKGYAMIKRDHHILTSINDIKVKDEIEIELKDGYVYTEVKRKKEK
jgi:exodeoxyribonuclease VII large subunit